MNPSHTVQAEGNGSAAPAAAARDRLAEILERHRAWVESGGQAGERADFRDADLGGVAFPASSLLRRAALVGANLEGAGLAGADLAGADLAGADLSRAKLSRASLRGADLTGASAADADLTGADLQDAVLREANLTGAVGLLPDQLAGADLTNARLPAGLGGFEGLKAIEELSKMTQTYFITVLLGCVYSWLTMATTPDSKLITDSASSPLPIIGTPIPINSFYLVAPLILLVLYVHFHLYLHRMWGELASLPAFFPDGRPLDRAAYPWLLNSLVRRHVKLLRPGRPHLSRSQVWISTLLSWWLVPFTLFLFWGDYIAVHEGGASLLHVLMLAVSVGAGLRLYHMAASTLGRYENPAALRSHRRQGYAAGLLVFVVFFFLTVFGIGGVGRAPGELTFRTREKGPEALDEEVPDLRARASTAQRWVPRLMGYVGFTTFADVRQQDVSSKPENWKQDDLEAVKGARLDLKDLRFIDARRAFFVKSDLSWADLSYGIFYDADFRAALLKRAYMRRAEMHGADFSKAVLEGADLRAAELKKVNFSGANLQGANLAGAEFFMNSFKDANLQGADLRHTELWFIDLTGANLTGAKLDGAKFHPEKLGGANLSKIDFTNIELSPLLKDLRGVSFAESNLSGKRFYEVNLSGADLGGANLADGSLFKSDLQRANLKNADFSGAYLGGSNLFLADLGGANLRTAGGLTQEQIEKAFVDDATLLPDHIRRPGAAAQAKLRAHKAALDSGGAAPPPDSQQNGAARREEPSPGR